MSCSRHSKAIFQLRFMRIWRILIRSTELEKLVAETSQIGYVLIAVLDEPAKFNLSLLAQIKYDWKILE